MAQTSKAEAQPPAAYTRNQKFQTPEGEVTFKGKRADNIVFEIEGNPIAQILPPAKFDALVGQAAHEQKRPAEKEAPEPATPAQAGATEQQPQPGSPDETVCATAKTQPTNGEAATRLPTDSHEPSEEDIAEHHRLCLLYDRLSSEERAFVSVQWDYDHGLECWQERLRAKAEASNFAARRRWQTYGVVAVLLWYGSCCYRAYRDANYARDRLEWFTQKAQQDSALKAAIEEVDRERYEYYRSLKEDDEQ